MERRRFWSYFFAAAGLIVLYCVLQKLSVVGAAILWVFGVFSPIFTGLILAFVLNLPMRGLERFWNKCDLGVQKLVRKCSKKSTKKGEIQVRKVSAALRRPLCLLASIIIILLLLSAVVALVLPELGNAIMMILNGVPEFFTKVQKWAMKYVNEYPEISEAISQINIDWEKTAKELLPFVGNGLELVGNTFGRVIGALGGMIDFIISLIFAIYVLLNKEVLARQLKRLMAASLSDKAEKAVLHVAQTSHDIFCAFVTGQCVEAVILGSLCGIGMVLFRFPYAVMIGVLVGVTALIPVVGGFIGAGVGAFLILMTNPFQALMFVIYIVVLQQIEGNVIYPKVVGGSVGLPAMWVLGAVTVGGGVGGVVGMLFAVPTVSVLYTLLREWTAKRLEKKACAAGEEKK